MIILLLHIRSLPDLSVMFDIYNSSTANEKKRSGERHPPYVASLYCMWLVIPDSARRFESLTQVIQEPASPTSMCSED